MSSPTMCTGSLSVTQPTAFHTLFINSSVYPLVVPLDDVQQIAR